MKHLLVFLFVGFFGQLIDGSLGMSAGLTSTSLLLAYGAAPAIVSASIHIAEIATTAASGASHLKFGNVDKSLVKTLIIPGSIGAFVGACFLSFLPGDVIKPYIAGILLMIGVYILFRYVFDIRKPKPRLGNQTSRTLPLKRRVLYPLAVSAGFLDAIGGGGWGPVNTPVLISNTHMKPRKVVGSVDTSEFFIAISATAGFLISLGFNDINWAWAASLAIGGIMAAPLAAWVIKLLPSSALGILVGGVIILTSTNTMLNSFDKGMLSAHHDAIYSSLITLWVFTGVFTIWRKKSKK